MIIDELRLVNFGIFRDEHVIPMAPPSKKKPVILFGGLNGSGKTTFLDALQLVLYGKMARCSNRGSMAYEQYLKKCINRNVPQEHGAEISIAFNHVTHGKRRYFKVTRRWSCQNDNIKEYLEVMSRSEGDSIETYDPVLTESWPEQVNSFIPGNISPLFFFDGEKIEALADLEKSQEIMKTAIQGLLGLDIVDRLEGDLEILERQKRIQQKNETDRVEIIRLESEIEHESKMLEKLHIDLASSENEIVNAQNYLERCSKEFSEEGGSLFEQKEHLDKEKKVLDEELENLKKSVQELVAGLMPLSMLRKQLEAVQEIGLEEEEAEKTKQIIHALQERDRKILTQLEKRKIEKSLMVSINELLEKDIQSRQKHTPESAFLNISREGIRQITDLLSVGINREREAAKRVIEKSEICENSLVEVKRKISAVPSETRVAEVFKKREKARVALVQATSKKKAIEELVRSNNNRMDELKRKRKVLLESRLEEQIEEENNTRIIKHSVRLRETLERFRTEIIKKHVQKIQFHVMDSFEKLFRKKSLLIDLKIDPKTLEVELISTENHKISPERLSAGERQILATSLLWGLARAAGRTLPAVIDTPLGRLDTKHRSYLVERYFPFASHQVILLSTDEEITNQYYDKLKPFIGHSYTLSYDEKAKTSRVTAGYFEDEK